jgi:peptide deformylase
MQSTHGPVIVCNPEITLGEETMYGDEGCLSMPGVQEQVIRAANITMKFRSPMGAPGTIKLDGMDARVVQHEVDHLDGINFVDRLPRNLKKRAMKVWDEKLRKSVA